MSSHAGPAPWYASAAAIAAVVVIAAMYLWLAGASTLFDRDEPRFSRAAVTMVQTGDYLVPRFNDQLRPDKPIGVYWMMSAFIHALGPTDFACRAGSAICTAGVCLLLYILCRRLLRGRRGHVAGMWAMAAMAGCLLMIQDGGAAIADPLLLLCMTGAMVRYVWTIGQPRFSWRAVIEIGLLLGAAQLAKGPVALLAAANMLTFAWLMRRGRDEARTSSPSAGDAAGRAFASDAGRIMLAVVIACIVFVAWGLPAYLAAPDLLELGLGKHVVERAIDPAEGHGNFLGGAFAYVVNLPTYLLVILLMWAPWSFFLPLVIAWLRARPTGDDRSGAEVDITQDVGAVDRRLLGRLAAAWSAPTLIVMTLVATKLPHYILPALPGLAVAFGGFMAMAGDGQAVRERWPRLWRWSMRLAWIVGGGVGAAMLVGPAIGWLATGGSHWRELLTAIGPAITVMGVIALLGVVAGVRALNVGRVRLAAGVGLMVLVGWMGVLAGWLLPQFEAFKPGPKLGGLIRERLDPATPLASYRYHDPSLVFYAGRSIEMLSEGHLPDLPARLAERNIRVLVFDIDQQQALVDAGVNVAAMPIIIEHVGGYDSRLRWRDLRAVRVDGPAQPAEGQTLESDDNNAAAGS